MPQTARSIEAGMVYHVLNRGIGRLRLFHKEGDYDAFEQVLVSGVSTSISLTVSVCPLTWTTIVSPSMIWVTIPSAVMTWRSSYPTNFGAVPGECQGRRCRQSQGHPKILSFHSSVS